MAAGGKDSERKAGKRAPGSPAVQDYLEQIHILIESKGYARVVDIASNLGISQASVSNMVRRLDAGGYVVYERYRGMTLTAEGEGIARSIARRHDVLSRLFAPFGIDAETLHEDVEGMEHHISPPTLRVLEGLVAELESNPGLVRSVGDRVEKG